MNDVDSHIREILKTDQLCFVIEKKMKDIHKTTQCYCGQSGDEKMNMLYCVKCKHWLHEECVKCLDLPVLLGDRFYILICSVCNAGSECLARVEMTWCDLIHLVLYNLSVTHKKKYFDLDESIIPFIADNWERLRVFGPINNVKPEQRKVKILETLHKNSKRFKCGREIKKSKNIFCLRQKVPPESPSVQASAVKVKNDSVMWEFLVKERPYHILKFKKSKRTKETTKNKKSKPKQNGKLQQTTQSHSKEIISKCRGGLPYNENGIHKPKNHRAKRTNVHAFNEESAKQGLLDSLIPVPSDFTQNNPFLQSNISNRTNCHPCKRKLNGEQTDSQKPSKLANLGLPKNDSEKSLDTKDNLSQTNGKPNGVRVVGKRITSNGKVQYLLQRNR
ncbi:hypothetical protein CEXT_665981 [Caerostris extrusa]|uniref:Uncharacterized protein n=1 Tax=Caerostris extrusa TaxID=172846 RepID=A0AAV4VAM9_CAEEX|nr:hypothetical protein CEXT_665981 [Caerostris extrusa]